MHVTTPPTAQKPLPARRVLRSPKAISIFLGFLLVVLAGMAGMPWLRGEKLRLVILRHQVERSAAPGETIVLDDWLLFRALAWKGSPALRHQLIKVDAAPFSAQLLSHEEMVVVVPEGDPLLSVLRSNGFVLTPNASQEPSLAAKRGFRVPGKGAFRIYFAVRPIASPLPANTEP